MDFSALETKLLLAVFIFVIGLGCGFAVDRQFYDAFKSNVKGEGIAQVKIVKIENRKNTEDSNVSLKKYQDDILGVHAYYKLHPVVRMQYRCPGTVPGTAGDTQGAHAAASGLYASPYSPVETEVVAARLYDLQTRLIAGGVKVGN